MENTPTLNLSSDQSYQNWQLIAHELENEVNETLASVLLWMRHAKNTKLQEDHSLGQAETNLKAAIVYVRNLRCSISTATTA